MGVSRVDGFLQVNEYKYEMERLTRELQDAKRKHYEHKRREQVRPSACNLRRSNVMPNRRLVVCVSYACLSVPCLSCWLMLRRVFVPDFCVSDCCGRCEH